VYVFSADVKDTSAVSVPNCSAQGIYSNVPSLLRVKDPFVGVSVTVKLETAVY
jgi:hypothetical protein